MNIVEKATLISKLARELRARIRAECPDAICALAVTELVAAGVLAAVRDPGTEREDVDMLASGIRRRLIDVRETTRIAFSEG